MSVKQRLQRVLQILEESERTGALSELERDIVLVELREAYSEIKFLDEKRETENESKIESESTPVTSTEEEQTDDEPEVEVELLFAEDTEETENEERKTENEEQEQEQEQEAETPITPTAPTTPTETVQTKSESNYEELSSFVSRLSSKKGSALLSLYDDDAAPVIGEQFHEAPSVADTIACPKGVAESAPVTSLREAIGVADRFMLIRELFGGDSDAYELAINALDKQQSFDDCVIYISENYSWRAQAEGTKFMMELLQRKFNE
mgnify:CR=1 FL=1